MPSQNIFIQLCHQLVSTLNTKFYGVVKGKQVRKKNPIYMIIIILKAFECVTVSHFTWLTYSIYFFSRLYHSFIVCFVPIIWQKMDIIWYHEHKYVVHYILGFKISSKFRGINIGEGKSYFFCFKSKASMLFSPFLRTENGRLFKVLTHMEFNTNTFTRTYVV